MTKDSVSLEAVKQLRCSRGHAGNRSLHRIGRDVRLGFQCAGCGQLFTVDTVSEAITAIKGGREHSLVAS